MKGFVKTIILMALSFGTAAGVATVLGLPEQPHSSTRTRSQAVELTKSGALQDLTSLQAEMERLNGKLQGDLTALRSQLARVDRDQEATGQQLNQIADQLGQTESTEAARGADEATVSLTLEQERERAEARTQAEIALLEGTLLAEHPDPVWATTTQLALNETFQKKAIPGAQLLDAHCRTTLCRLEMTLESATAQDSYRDLLDLAPWSGESLVQINTETGEAVMYLTREERTLPQMTEQ